MVQILCSSQTLATADDGQLFGKRIRPADTSDILSSSDSLMKQDYGTEREQHSFVAEIVDIVLPLQTGEHIL